jgi:hypothetical protein
MPGKLGDPRLRLTPAQVRESEADCRAAAELLREQGLGDIAALMDGFAEHYAARRLDLAAAS